MQRTNLRMRTVAQRKNAIDKYCGLKLDLNLLGSFAIILSVRISCNTALISRPYFAFLIVKRKAERMQPCECVQKGVCEFSNSSMKFIIIAITLVYSH